MKQCGLLVLFVLAALVLGFFLVVTSRQQDLQFDTIDQNVGFGYKRTEPAILIIAGPQDVLDPGLSVQPSAALQTRLNDVNYSHYFVVLALQGLKHTSGYRITIQRITQQYGRIAVQAKFQEPSPGTFTLQGFTSPYDLIMVSKDSGISGQVRFVLLRGSKVVAQTTHLIP